MLDDTYSAAWRDLPRADRRRAIEAMYAIISALSLSQLIDHVSAWSANLHRTRIDGATKHRERLQIRLAKSEILRRDARIRSSYAKALYGDDMEC